MSNSLFLIVSKKWFDMIASGKKREEYRRACPHWDKLISKNKPSEVLFQLGYNKKQRTRFEIWAVSKYDGGRVTAVYGNQINSIEASPNWGFNHRIPQYIITLSRRIE